MPYWRCSITVATPGALDVVGKSLVTDGWAASGTLLTGDYIPLVPNRVTVMGMQAKDHNEDHECLWLRIRSADNAIAALVRWNFVITVGMVALLIFAIFGSG